MSNLFLSEEEAHAFLLNIEKKEIQLQPLRDPQKVFSGDIKYAASNGWTLTVFNDANTWDYVDKIETDDGRVLEFDDLDRRPVLRNYCPPKEISIEVYQIPDVF